MRGSWLVGLVCSVALGNAAEAAKFTLSGSLGDAGNAALLGSDLGPARFDDDTEIANNVATYRFNLPTASTVSFDSSGFAAGGAGPYFALFQGIGRSAVFLASNYLATGVDFKILRTLPAGNYTVSIGVWQNMSFAENGDTGTIGDGFIGLGVPGELGDTSYELVISTPEPASAGGFGAAASALAAIDSVRRRRRHDPGSRSDARS